MSLIQLQHRVCWLGMSLIQLQRRVCWTGMNLILIQRWPGWAPGFQSSATEECVEIPSVPADW